MADAIHLIAGLGNPGPEYENTRHNAGAWVVSAIANEKRACLRLEPRFKGLCAKVSYNTHDVWLLFPSTYMNHSGSSVAAMMRYYQIPVSQLLVIHDELDLPTGTCRLKKGGGHAGHNGLRDIASHLGSADFLRLRIGIGHPGHREKVLNYVLGTPAKSEREELNVGISRTLEVMPLLVRGDIEAAMHRLHSEVLR